MWLAAEQAYPGRRFHKYAVLGDDVVIGDARVATQYSSLLELLGVDISIDKSLQILGPLSLLKGLG